jgi:hypothetical protein
MDALGYRTKAPSGVSSTGHHNPGADAYIERRHRSDRNKTKAWREANRDRRELFK